MTEDTCRDVYAPTETPYEWPKDMKCKKAELPEFLAEQAIAYIRVLTLRYPFQMRQYLGEPMWMRFCDVWADTGDIVKAMRAI